MLSEYTTVKCFSEFASFMYSPGDPEIVREMQSGNVLLRSVFGKSEIGGRKTLSVL
jgi:hypothetical protein